MKKLFYGILPIFILILSACDEELVIPDEFTENSRFEIMNNPPECSTEPGEYFLGNSQFPPIFDSPIVLPPINGVSTIFRIEYEIIDNRDYVVTRYKERRGSGFGSLSTEELWTVTGELKSNGELIFKDICDSDLIYNYFAEQID